MPQNPRHLVGVSNKKITSEFLVSLKQQNWDQVCQEKDLNRGFNQFYKRFKELHDEKFPLKKLSRKKAKDKPWMNKDLHEMRKKRDEN